MKIIRTILLALVALAIVKVYAHGAEAKSPVDWFKGIEVGAVGAIRQADFVSGHSEKGAGVKLGFALNKYVTLEGRVLSFEESPKGDESDRWKGDTVDEIAIGVRSSLLNSANKKLSLEGIGGLDRSQQIDDFGFHIGLQASWRPTKNVSVSVGREIRTWLHNSHDHLSFASVGYAF